MTTTVVNGRTWMGDGVWVDRRSPYGNPHRIGRDGTRAEGIAKYRRWFIAHIQRDPEFKAGVLALRGKTLICWCAPLACHADVIVQWLEHH
mgnify:FL=1